MDVKFINPFIRSVHNVFTTMCHTTVTIGKPTLKSQTPSATDVSGVIGFSGDASGCVVMDFSFDTAKAIVAAFAGEPFEPHDADFADAIGELVNMVAGSAKAQLEGLRIDISLPSVVVGEKHNVQAPRSAPRIVIPCQTPLGSFNVEVGMLVANKSKAPADMATAGATS